MRKTPRNMLPYLLAAALVLALGLLPATGWMATDLVPAAMAAEGPAGGHAGHGGTPPPQAQAPVKDEFGEETSTIEIPADQQQLIGVRTSEAKILPLHRTIRTIGRIENDERGLATINTKIEGWIERLHVNATGEFVKKGEPVIEIYSPEFYATQQEFLNVLKWVHARPEASGSTTAGARKFYDSGSRDIASLLARDARTMAAAARQRLRLWDISDAQIAAIERSGVPVRTITIHSPVSGYVMAKPALEGMRVMPGEKLLDIADLSTVWVMADIFENDLPLVKTGQKAMISLNAFPGEKFESVIDYLYPALAGETRTMKARLVVANPDGRFKPQMFTDVEILVDLGKKLAVPEAAVLNTGTRQMVYLDQGDGVFEPREVTTGLRAEGLIEITAGLAPGDKVASEANFLIDSEARLKGVVQ